MEKLPMCRICLVEDVRMYVVVNKNLHELYEKLIDVPFVTEDSRPMLACSFCCAKLKQCWRFQRKCLEAEEMFTLMMDEDYEQDPLISQEQLSFYNNKFMITPIENINIVSEYRTESDTIKKEMLDVPTEEYQTYESELDNVDNIYPDVEATVALHAESDSDDAPLLKVKSEVEVEPEPGLPVAKKPKLVKKRSIPTDTTPVQHVKNENYPQLPNVLKKETAQNHSSNYGVNNNFTNAALDTTSHNSNKKIIKCEISYKSTDCYESSFKCGICQKILKRKRNLKNHMLVHTGEKPFKCEICQKGFTRKDILNTHRRDDHSGEGPFKCEICQKSFERIRYLKNHIRVHTGESQYKCTICQHSFSQKSVLVTHIRVHTDEKPYKCDICQRSFRQTGNLTNHIRTHTGEKPFKCDICLRSFTQKGNLLSHVRSHTGEKPFKCNICQKCFSKKSYLVNHTCNGARNRSGKKNNR